MSKIEPAKVFAVRLNDLLCEHDRRHTVDTGEEEVAGLIEADRNAVRAALLGEFRERLQRYYEHARGPAEVILSELETKYTQPKESTSG